MLIKTFFAIFLFSIQVLASSEVEIKKFDIPITAPANLMQESTLKLDTELTIQEIAPRSDLTFGILGGTMRPQRVSIESHGRTVNYDFNKRDALPFLAAQFTYLPLMQKWGKLGITGSLGYTYGEYYQNTVTSLHVLPIELSAIYRMDLKYSQVVVPFISYGRQSIAFFQRGIDQYNTSENFDAWVGTAGLAFNLSRLKIFNSRNEMEIIFQYKRSYATATAKVDINSQTYQVGGAFSL